MSLFRLILIGIAIYLISRVFKNLLNPPPENRHVDGNAQTPDPIDLSGAEIEDAEFEEIDGDEKSGI